jgi:hypothetical protein
MAQAPLTVLKGGINRLRTKGGARADQLYDLLNGYLTKQGTVTVRPGTRRTHTLDSLTRGLCDFSGGFHTFCHQIVTVPSGFTLHVLVSPESDDTVDPPVVYTLSKIHFAKPFLGYLYVAAEFSNGSIFHYWLQQGTTWAASTIYKIGDLVQPTVVNGIAYQATRSSAANPVWTAGTPRQVGDIVEPTEYNGYYYTVVDTAGASPSSGDTEPDWPEAAGAQIVENTDTTPSPDATSGTNPATTPGSDVLDRYDY